MGKWLPKLFTQSSRKGIIMSGRVTIDYDETYSCITFTLKTDKGKTLDTWEIDQDKVFVELKAVVPMMNITRRA